jgi:hypothetical protein
LQRKSKEIAADGVQKHIDLCLSFVVLRPHPLSLS